MGSHTKFHAKLRGNFQDFQHAFTSKQAFLKYLETSCDAGSVAGPVRNKWTNEDLDISPTTHHT
ncbi:hypothetical protein PV05_06054 [Exophiala xenobiotica]|uniref:Uncharacterized protein n=1 Tax=Exophiala xenobiotica TaxID=348802 RepID=A0A0D2BYP1_9EURO|nr:uncharacterized protein PV05_06054 [Exophiala xenobiotica]KIW57511.1 hypothetical protein PV05_06054 [Exophiala xenobiotica]